MSPPGSPNSPPVSSPSPVSLPPENSSHYSPPQPPRSPLSSPRQSANISSSRSNLDHDVNRMREILETLEKFENEDLETDLSTTSGSLQSTVSSLSSTNSSNSSTTTSNLNLNQKLQEQKILINHYRQNSYKTEQKNIKKIKSLRRYSSKLRDEREGLKDKITNYQNTVITCNETLQEAVQSIHQKNRQIQQLQTANTDLSNNLTSLTTRNRNRNNEGNNLCKLCLSSIRTVVLIPCKHLSMCRSCERRNSIHHIDNHTYQPLCPICRTPYTDTLNIFNS